MQNFYYVTRIMTLMVLASLLHVGTLHGQTVMEAADTYLRSEEQVGFSGTVLLVKDGRIVHAKGYGFSDRDRAIRNAPGTVYPIGSITKLFTRDTIGIMRESGKLKPKDKLGQFFPDSPSDKSDITVDQLLRHTSGLDTYHGADFEHLDRRSALDRIFAQELRFAPGSDHSYSNSGYAVLAAIVEVVSGESFPDFVMKELIVPAGLKRSGFYGFSRWDADSVAIGYEGQQNGSVNSPAYWELPEWGLMGAGGLASTAGDLHRFMQWRKNRFGLSKLIAQPFNPEKGSRTDQAPVFVAGGGNWGYYAVYVEFGDGNAIAVLSNADADGVEDLTLLNSLANILFGEAPLTRTKPALLEPEKLSDSIAGQRMSALVDIVNDGDEIAVRSFVMEHMDRGFQRNVDRMIGFIDAVRDELGPDAAISSFVQEGPYTVVAFIQNRNTKQWYTAYLEVDDVPPHAIAGLRTDESEPPSQ